MFSIQVFYTGCSIFSFCPSCMCYYTLFCTNTSTTQCKPVLFFMIELTGLKSSKGNIFNKWVKEPFSVSRQDCSREHFKFFEQEKIKTLSKSKILFLSKFAHDLTFTGLFNSYSRMICGHFSVLLCIWQIKILFRLRLVISEAGYLYPNQFRTNAVNESNPKTIKKCRFALQQLIGQHPH